MASVPFSLSEFDHPETKALGMGNLRLAEKMNFSPVKLKAVYILRCVITPDPSFCIRGKCDFFIWQRNLS